MNRAYGLDEAQIALTTRAAAIAADVAAKHAADVDAQGRFPDESIAALARDGFFGLTVPTNLGGMGQGPRTFAAVAEILAERCASTAMVYVMHVSATQSIGSSTTLAARESLLREIAAGKHLTTLALSERGSRSQFWAPVSKLVARDGGWVTQAQKSWITSAGHADSYVASAQAPGAASPLESTVYLTRRSAPGVRSAGRFDGLGLRGNDSAPVTFEDVAVGQDDLISPLGAGAKTMLEVVLPWFAMGTAGMSNGLCRATLAATIGHLQGTGFEHTGTQLRDLPNLRARVAAMSVRTEQARALLRSTLDEVEAGRPEAPLFVLSTRLASLEAALEVTDLGMKTCGGAAFSKQLPVERLFRDARAGWVMAPTVDHLADFLGKALTGLPLF